MTKWRALLVCVLAVVLIAIGFTGGVVVDRVGVTPGSAPIQTAGEPAGFDIFWQAWSLAEKNFVNRSALDATKMTYGAITGMLDALGDEGHTRFLSPADLKLEQDALSGKLEGIGAEVGVRGGQLVIVAPIPGSPAQKAGFRAGDQIMRVNGQSVEGMSSTDLVNLVRGPAGTSVTLSVIHRGTIVVTDITVVRAKLTVPNVSWALVPGTKTAHILISQFGDQTTDQLVATLRAARAAGATSIILDLRNNPGGIRDEAIAVASQFVADGNVLIEQDAQGKQTVYAAKSGGLATDLPMVVLVNEGTASSSEIVAGALQDHQRGQIVGTTTFGTGTVLGQYKLGDGSAILLGISQWLTPNGRQIWHQGIVPDLKVDLALDGIPLLPDEETTMTAPELQASHDAQLLKAVQLLGTTGQQ